MSPFLGLLKSRKFWLLILDTSVSVSLMLFAENEQAKFIILAIQPVFVTLIVAVAYEDVGIARATGLAPGELRKDKKEPLPAAERKVR